MAPRFSRPRLHTADDKQYRAFLARIMLSKDNQRPIRPATARDLFGGEAEAALRGWLGERLPLTDQRFVEYQEHRGRTAITKYRELDAVSLDGWRRVYVFEMKASQKARSVRRAVRQLQDTRAIIGQLFPHVVLTIMLVDTGIPTADTIPALMAAPDAPPEPPPTLDDVLAMLPQVRLVASLDEPVDDPETIRLLRFSVDDIVALAGAENLHLDWDTEDEETAEDVADEPTPPLFLYSTEQSAEIEEDDGGAFGAAFRQAEQTDKKKRKR